MSTGLTILVCGSDSPFGATHSAVRGRSIVRALRDQGHTADLVTLPSTSKKADAGRDGALAWRLVDLTAVDGVRVDIVVCVDPASLYLRHATKILCVDDDEDLGTIPRHEVTGAVVSSAAVAERLRLNPATTAIVSDLGAAASSSIVEAIVAVSAGTRGSRRAP